MTHTARFDRTLRCGLLLACCIVLPACTPGGEETLPSTAIFHPGGASALRPSSMAVTDLVVRESTYIPVYSNIHWGGRNVVTELAATISIRNVDADRPLVLLSATYYDSLGQPIEDYVAETMELDPMSTVEFIVERADTRGGSGANFLVEWGSTGAIDEPVMEAIMLGQMGNAGISFVSRSRTRARRAPVASNTS